MLGCLCSQIVQFRFQKKRKCRNRHTLGSLFSPYSSYMFFWIQRPFSRGGMSLAFPLNTGKDNRVEEKTVAVTAHHVSMCRPLRKECHRPCSVYIFVAQYTQGDFTWIPKSIEVQVCYVKWCSAAGPLSRGLRLHERCIRGFSSARRIRALGTRGFGGPTVFLCIIPWLEGAVVGLLLF